MNLYHCQLIFHEHLFYETRTMGRLYETGRLLHNIALCYALGLAQTNYHQPVDRPNYAAELEQGVIQRGIYVTPAKGVDVRYVVHTFKLGEERLSVRMEKSNANLPSYGRAKEVAVGSRFQFGILSEKPLESLPRWIRMGLWMSKAQLSILASTRLERDRTKTQETVSLYPMNPGDLPPSATLDLFDLIAMRPSSLVENALISAADGWWRGKLTDASGHEQKVVLPFGLEHRIPS